MYRLLLSNHRHDGDRRLVIEVVCELIGRIPNLLHSRLLVRRYVHAEPGIITIAGLMDRFETEAWELPLKLRREFFHYQIDALS